MLALALAGGPFTTRDVSETGVFIEWSESTSIPLYRLVTFQLERDARNADGLPIALRVGKVLSAVYRAGDRTQPLARFAARPGSLTAQVAAGDRKSVV